MRNHKSAMEKKVEIHLQLGELAEDGLIEWWDPSVPRGEFAQNINPFGAVPKPNGDVRILVDPTITGVNDCMIRLPVRLPTVEEALQATDPTSILGKRDQAFLVLSYFGFLRRSETLALRLGDISVRRTPEGRLYLHLLIRKSKTDIYSEGVELCIAYSSQSGIAVFLLVQLYLDYLKLWSVSPQEALFQSFVDKSERPVTTSSLGKDALSARLRYYLKLVAQENPGLGLDVTTYASHSLRRGGVSAAWQCDVGRELLKGHGRWSSDAIDLYLHAGLDTKLTVTGRM
jgi:integrase